jgi:hypothetical protein
MTATLQRVREVTDLRLAEAAAGGDPFNPDGTVDVVILRPCNGRGLGARIYEPDMLARDADAFSGVSMYWNHDAAQAQRARGGIPRSPADLAGWIEDAWWDSTFVGREDAELGYGRGAVIGRAKVTDEMAALIRRIPEAIRTSVNASATGMRPGSRSGQRGMLVEGIARDKEQTSVDFVVRAGAGGGVARVLREAAMERSTNVPTMTLREALASPEVREYIRDLAGPYRPQVWATPPADERQIYLERLATGEVHLEIAAGEPLDLRSEGEKTRQRIVESGLPVTPEVALRLAEAADDPSRLRLPPLPSEIRSPAPTTFGGPGSGWADRLRAKGLDPRQFGAVG